MSDSQPGNAHNHLATFSASVGHGVVYTGVPVSGPGLGWGPAAPVHLVDAVWVDNDQPANVIAWDPKVDAEFRHELSSHGVVLLSPRGYADRTAFGMLVACRELFSRAYPDHRLVGAMALADKLRWMSLCYLSEGISVQAPDGARLTNHTRHRSPQDQERESPTGEDLLVRRYYDECLNGQGTLWQEVPVASARLDGLHLPARAGGRSWWHGLKTSDLREALQSYDTEVIEAKALLNTDVIGQAIAGAILLAHECPDHRLIRQTVVIGQRPDPCLEWVCHKRGIQVVWFAPEAVRTAP